MVAFLMELVSEFVLLNRLVVACLCRRFSYGERIAFGGSSCKWQSIVLRWYCVHSNFSIFGNAVALQIVDIALHYYYFIKRTYWRTAAWCQQLRLHAPCTAAHYLQLQLPTVLLLLLHLSRIDIACLRSSLCPCEFLFDPVISFIIRTLSCWNTAILEFSTTNFSR